MLYYTDLNEWNLPILSWSRRAWEGRDLGRDEIYRQAEVDLSLTLKDGHIQDCQVGEQERRKNRHR